MKGKSRLTGDSTGIGYACVEVLTHRGFRVFGSVRTPADADRLVMKFGEKFVPLDFDVRDEAARRRRQGRGRSI